MKISNDEYLLRILKSKKLQLESLKIAYMISVAEYNVKTNMLNSNIESIEIQLSEVKK